MAYKKTYRRRKHIKRKTRKQRRTRTRTRPRTRTGGFFKYRCSEKDLNANSDEYYKNCCNKTWANMLIPGRKETCKEIEDLTHDLQAKAFYEEPFFEKPQPNNSTSTNSQTVVPY
jgi:hypothetical protein